VHVPRRVPFGHRWSWHGSALHGSVHPSEQHPPTCIIPKTDAPGDEMYVERKLDQITHGSLSSLGDGIDPPRDDIYTQAATTTTCTHLFAKTQPAANVIHNAPPWPE
jgi:hypothetical protein